MRLTRMRMLFATVTALALIVGVGSAIAATGSGPTLKQEAAGLTSRATFDAAVAKNLGTTTAKLNAAIKAAATARIDAALAADDATRCNRNGNQMELNACAAQDFKASDAKLNTRYKSAMAALSPDAQKALRDEQRAWLKQRDPTCRKRIEGLGSIAPLEYSACQKELTDLRVKQLEAISR